MKWDMRVGAEGIIRYPDEINVSEKTLMQVYSTHEYNQEAGMISMMIGATSIASYYTGSENSLYLILVLTVDEDPDSFEDGLADISRIIIQNLENEAFKTLIPSLYQRVSVYPTLDISQKLMMIYLDETKRLLLRRLQDEGSVSKSEISVWLKDKYQTELIISYHNFDHTPEKQDLELIMDECYFKSADIAKIACRVFSPFDVARLFSLYEKTGRKIIIGMGNPGKITRLAAAMLGAEFTYCSVSDESKTAEGQIDYKTMIKFYELLNYKI